MEHEVLKIIKVGKLEYMEPFLTKGEMYFDTVESFSKKDANQERYDKLEGAIELYQTDCIKIRTEDGTTFELSKANPKHIKVSSAFLTTHFDTIVGNIYCCSAITQDTSKSFENLDPRFRNFGDTVILIENTYEFKNRIIKELEKQKFSYEIKLVDYYEPNDYNGDLSVFDKKNVLSYQNELRIFIYNNIKEPIKICIGSITDIACKFKLDELLNIQSK